MPDLKKFSNDELYNALKWHEHLLFILTGTLESVIALEKKFANYDKFFEKKDLQADLPVAFLPEATCIKDFMSGQETLFHDGVSFSIKTKVLEVRVMVDALNEMLKKRGDARAKRN